MNDGKATPDGPHGLTPPGAVRSPETPEQRHARRVAWGKDSGAKVAAAYKALQGGS